MGANSVLTLPVPRDFVLRRVVCSYGYFLLAPNRWDPRTQTLTRPLHGRRGRLITVTISQASMRLRLACDQRVDAAERTSIKRDVTRMLRIDEDPRPWWKLNPSAKRAGFARMFRSPSLFEDMVKTITGCNVTWTNTMNMNHLLVQRIGRGGFPTPKQVAAYGIAKLKTDAKVGYRAERIVRLAERFMVVGDGGLDPAWFESPDRTSGELFAALKSIHGIGPYAAANLCMLLGHDDRLAIDTETYRHYCRLMKLDRPPDPKTLHPEIEKHYATFAPYQFKAYWFELWRDYERRVGPAHTWDAQDVGRMFTAVNLRE